VLQSVPRTADRIRPSMRPSIQQCHPTHTTINYCRETPIPFSLGEDLLVFRYFLSVVDDEKGMKVIPNSGLTKMGSS
jgi:hypothetical protein